MGDRLRSGQPIAARAARGTARRPRQPVRSRRFVLVGLGTTATVAVALLVGLGLSSMAEHDWHAALTIDGESISRADFRARGMTLEALAAARAAMVDRLWLSGQASDAERAEIEGRTAVADPLTATIEDLVREHAVRDAAEADGIRVSSVDPWTEFARSVVEPAAAHVRYVVVSGPADPSAFGSRPDDWPAIPPGGGADPAVLVARDAAGAVVAATIGAAPASDVVAAAKAAGWTATGADAWLPATGPVPGMPASLVARLRDPAMIVGSLVEPYLDASSGDLLVAVLLGVAPTADPDRVRRDLEGRRVDEGALQAWADARALERALAEARLAAWTATPSLVVQEAEVVISSTDIAGASGPYAGLAHLVVDRLPADLVPAADRHPIRAVGTPAGVLASALRALPRAERLKRWDALVSAANASAPYDPSRQSGELGWYDASRLRPELAVSATGAGAIAGQIVGPVATEVGTELFLVRGTYPGVLDERAAALLVEASASPDLTALARRIAPGAAFLRYGAGVERSELETFDNIPAGTAIRESAIGRPTQPFALDGDIVVAIPRVRQSAVPAGQTRDRIQVSAFAAWIGERMTALDVRVDANPYGLSGDAGSPAPTSAAIPTLEPMATPPVVTLPGASAP